MPTDPSWLDACARFAQQQGLPAEALEPLRVFDRPFPRGGPPASPERRWDSTFAALEVELLSRDPFVGVPAALGAEVDDAQARMFGRRARAVDELLRGLPGPHARLLRVGLRQRLRGILAAAPSRALRVRALADFFYSQGALLQHRLEGPPGPDIRELVGRLEWRSLAPGLEHALLSGATDQGPVHCNLLRMSPEAVRLQVVDRRDRVAVGESLAEHVRRAGALAAVSGGFFLYSEPDLRPPSRRYDAVGLLLCEGELRQPPLLPRGALLLGVRGGAVLRVLRPEECAASVAGLPLPLSPRQIFTRAVAERGPDRPSLAIVGLAVTAVGRALAVPLNGAVVTLDGSDPALADVLVGARVEWHLPSLSGGEALHNAIAGGPMLLRHSTPCIQLQAEGFWGSAPPVTFSQDETGDRNLLPRLVAGLDGDGSLIFAAVDGRNFQRALGMTLRGSARLLAELGCETALNLDGGASKRMVVQGRAVDLASTEVQAGSSGPAHVRPVHSAVLIWGR